MGFLRTSAAFPVLIGAVALYALSPIITGFHLATIPHHFCAEHGTLEHNDCAGDCHSDDHGEQLAWTHQSYSSSSSSPKLPHQHRLCSTPTTAQRDAVDADESDCGAVTLITRFWRSQILDEEHRGLLAIEVAPKNSPPAFS